MVILRTGEVYLEVIAESLLHRSSIIECGHLHKTKENNYHGRRELEREMNTLVRERDRNTILFLPVNHLELDK